MPFFVPRESAGRVRAAIDAVTGVPAAHIMLTATHTHSAPKTVDYLSNVDDPPIPPVDPGYLRFFEEQMIVAACAAVREGAGPPARAWPLLTARAWGRTAARCPARPIRRRRCCW